MVGRRVPEELLQCYEHGRAHRGDFESREIRLGPSPPWDYVARGRSLLRHGKAVLDIGTGSGTVFHEMCAEWSGLAVATEAWRRNLPIARRRLASIGASVVRASRAALPFAASTFDLIVVRRTAFTARDVARVLTPGGSFLTEQIGRAAWHELRPFFPRMTDFGPRFERHQAHLREAGLVLRGTEQHDVPVAIGNLGDLVHLLAARPWKIPDFDVERDMESLLAAERALTRPEGIVLTESHYLIEAWKPR
jgi:SAM-dependent methyltransferase